MLRGKGPHETEMAYDFLSIHSFMIYTDLNEYHLVGNAKAPLRRCFSFISKRKAVDFKITVKNSNRQTFTNLQNRPLPKQSFHSFHVDLRGILAGKKPMHLLASLVRFLCLSKSTTLISDEKDQYNFHTMEVSVRSVEKESVHLLV